MRKGRVLVVKGPVVIGGGIPDVKLGELVLVGEEGLLGEVVESAIDHFVVQLYEDPSGLKPGEEIVATGSYLAAELGPGLLTSILDGVGRPLDRLLETQGPFIRRGVKMNALDRSRKWHFEPRVKVGDKVAGGDVLGVVRETSMIVHRIKLPLGVSGRVKEVYEGDFTVEDTVVVVEQDGASVEVKMVQEWPIRQPRPFRERVATGEPLVTGQRVIDTFFPIAKGGTACVPGGFGTGKTMLLHKIAMWSDADVVVYVGCGERGNEISEMLTVFPKLLDPRTKKPLIERTVIVANTSNMPVLAREASVYLGVTIAEYYRDQGYDVVMIADSSSRWAEALRELASRLEEIPVEEGYPAYLPHRLAEFYERAGRVVPWGRPETTGSVTIIAAVSPPGGDFSEPVTVHTQRFVDVMWALDPELAYRRHFPAVNWLLSFSRYVEGVERWWDERFPGFSSYRRRALRLLTIASDIESIASVVGEAALPDDQRLILLIAEILREGFLRQASLGGPEDFCPPEKQFALLKAILDFYDIAYKLVREGVPVDEITRVKEVYELMRVKERSVEEIESLRARLERELEKLSRGGAT